MPDSIEKEQVLNYLGETYRDLVRKERAGPNRDEEERTEHWESAFPSRALACFYIETLYGLAPSEVVLWDVDGGEDEGIDLFYYDATNHHLTLLQSKASGDGGSDQPKLNDCLRFFDGFKIFLSGNLDRFGEFSTDHRAAAEEARLDTELKITLVLAHFGGELNEQRTQRAEEIKIAYDQSYNEPRLEFLNFGLDRSHAALMELRRADSVDCSLKLKSHARHEGNFRCIYGRVLAADLKHLHDGLDVPAALYAQNVRYFRGDNPVNLRVKETIEQHPENLFYLNNGVTALCRNIQPTPESTGRGDGEGEFEIEGLTIVNGAQTIGAISKHLPSDDDLAYVLIKIIQVEGDDEEIASQIADATNFQTVVENIDFLSTHPRHQSIAETLKESGILYHFRRSEDYGTNRQDPKQFNLHEVIETRLCVVGRAEMLRKLKRAPAEVHSDLRNGIGAIFPDSLSARTLWRQIQFARIAQDAISTAKSGQQHSYEQSFFTHGVYVLKYLILKYLRDLASKDELELSDADKSGAQGIADSIVITAFTTATAHFQGGEHDWNYVFRTLNDIREVIRVSIEKIDAEQEAQ